MFSSECNGCSPGFWPVSNVTFQAPNIVAYSRKSPSFRISDILHHVQNSGDYNRPDYRSGSNLAFCQTPSALGPLQAFCNTKRVQCFVSSSPATSTTATDRSEIHPACRQGSASTDTSKQLKFGINRILSNEFGKKFNEKENKHFRHIPTSHSTDYGSACGCGAPSCTFPLYTRITFPSPSLSAVHAIQPPHYPVSPQSGVDSLPGPYSILNDETNMGGHSKRKRSWSRAVFSNLQRKGLEKRFEVQKYVTKPDRRQLAAMLGLTDAQVKVWFQNRRMKWRHAQQMKVKDVQSNDENKDSESDNEASDHDDVILKNCDEMDSCVDLKYKNEDGAVSESEEFYESVDTNSQT